MKVLLLYLEITSALVSKYFAYPVVRTWTFHELRKAIEKEDTDTFVGNKEGEYKIPLMHAFGQMMSALFAGVPESAIAILLSPSGDKKWTREQLEMALNDEKTDVYITPFIGQAYVSLNNQKIKSYEIEVQIIALDISTWTKQDLRKALRDRSINPDLIRYLKEAQQEFKLLEAENKKKKGKIKEPVRNVTIITPVGLIPPPEGVKPKIVPKTAARRR